LGALPAIGFLFLGDDLEGSRYLYLPAVGWGLLIGAAIDATSTRRLVARTLAGMVTVLLVVAAIQQQTLIANWRAAAQQRDQILHAAVDAAVEHGCARPAFHGLPETYRGAQLLRNGAREAFEVVRPPIAGDRSCEMTWTGAGFVVR